jgi:hypothetical protein
MWYWHGLPGTLYERRSLWCIARTCRETDIGWFDETSYSLGSSRDDEPLHQHVGLKRSPVSNIGCGGNLEMLGNARR